MKKSNARETQKLSGYLLMRKGELWEMAKATGNKMYEGKNDAVWKAELFLYAHRDGITEADVDTYLKEMKAEPGVKNMPTEYQIGWNEGAKEVADLMRLKILADNSR